MHFLAAYTAVNITPTGEAVGCIFLAAYTAVNTSSRTV